MGQQKSSPISTNFREIQEKRPQQLKSRKSLHPLHYVKPIRYETDEPKSSNQLDFNQENVFDNNDNIMQVSSTDPKATQENDKQENQNFDVSSQLVHKKVEVKRGKFVTMKRKNFLTDYKIMNEIGRGGFGCVYRVSMRNDCNVLRAAKRINKFKLKSDEHKSLLQEMAIMMDLDHPNITKLYEVYDQQNHYVMIMELCEGGELFDRITTLQIEQQDAKIIMRQVLSALNYLHCQGIVHRDIKPENMIFEEKTKLIKIIDFGISTRVEIGQVLTERVGSPCYISPDVLSRNYNEKCDMWSLGVVLFMMIYRIPPFKGDNPTKMMASISKDNIIFRNPSHFKYSSLSLDFLKKLLNRNQDNRLSARQALSHKWLKKVTFESPEQNQQKIRKLNVLNRISKFHFKNKLEAVVNTYVVSQLLSAEERAQTMTVFQSLDQNQNGVLQVSELRKALSQNLLDVNQNKIKTIKDYLDTNCSGQIQYTEFLVGAIDPKIIIQRKHLDQAFAYLDIDRSGQITFEEIKQFLKDEENTLIDIKRLFRQLDSNGDGVLSRDEFVHIFAPKAKV